MRILLNIALISSLFITANSFAQQRDIDSKLMMKSSRIKRLVQNNLNVLSHEEKRELKQVLNQTLQAIQAIASGGGGNLPPAPQRPLNELVCAWKNGMSDGIGQRGYHLIEKIRGLSISREFFGNVGSVSAERCFKVLIQQSIHPADLAQTKRATCTCKWMDGMQSTNPGKRGVHMTFKIQSRVGNSIKDVNISSKFYGNVGTTSQQRCQNDLVATNFSCNI